MNKYLYKSPSKLFSKKIFKFFKYKGQQELKNTVNTLHLIQYKK